MPENGATLGGLCSGVVRSVQVRLDMTRAEVQKTEPLQNQINMPKKRPPKEIWQKIRKIILARDGYQCVRCEIIVTAKTAHVDHIKSGKLGTNEFKNLRTLCRRCHVLRADFRHRGMIAKALRDGIIPLNWRELVWNE